MEADETKKRHKFARSIKRDYSAILWNEEVAFYLDSKSFIHKYNPLDHARGPK